jgi:hypothetical protein
MMFQMVSCLAICWPLHGQWTKSVTNAFNLCPHSHVRRLNVEG